jgi:enoyl-CoA hydratase/carnithine racemase
MLRRPHRLNAIGTKTRGLLADAAAMASGDERVRALVIEGGAGRVFYAGGTGMIRATLSVAPGGDCQAHDPHRRAHHSRARPHPRSEGARLVMHGEDRGAGFHREVHLQ